MDDIKLPGMAAALPFRKRATKKQLFCYAYGKPDDTKRKTDERRIRTFVQGACIYAWINFNGKELVRFVPGMLNHNSLLFTILLRISGH